MSNESPNLELKETTEHIIVRDSDNDSPDTGVIKLDRTSGLLVFSGAVLPSGRRELKSLHKACLGMIVHNHHVNFRGAETWEFYRRGNSLGARVTGQAPSESDSDSGSNSGSESGSKQGEGQDENADPALTTPRSDLELFKVDSETFLSWLSSSTIDITNMLQPEDIVETDVGDLLLDPEFADCVYFDSVRIMSSKLGMFKFGYHYKDKDYDKIVSSDLELNQGDYESDLRCQIWVEGMPDYDALISIMLNLMRTKPWMPDVRGFEDILDCGTVETMRDYMVDEYEGWIFCNSTVFPCPLSLVRYI